MRNWTCICWQCRPNDDQRKHPPIAARVADEEIVKHSLAKDRLGLCWRPRLEFVLEKDLLTSPCRPPLIGGASVSGRFAEMSGRSRKATPSTLRRAGSSTRELSLSAALPSAIPRSVDVAVRATTGAHVQTVGLPAIGMSRQRAAARLADATACASSRTVCRVVRRPRQTCAGNGCRRPGRSAGGSGACQGRQGHHESRSERPRNVFHGMPQLCYLDLMPRKACASRRLRRDDFCERKA